MRVYCENCGRETQSVKNYITKEMNVKGKFITTTIKVLNCKKCGGEVYDENNEKENDEIVFHGYNKTIEVMK